MSEAPLYDSIIFHERVPVPSPLRESTGISVADENPFSRLVTTDFSHKLKLVGVWRTSFEGRSKKMTVHERRRKWPNKGINSLSIQLKKTCCHWISGE